MNGEFQALRALIVEDDRSWQSILVELLQDAGLVVDVTNSYATAATALRAAPHRVAVVDLSLGGVDHHNQDGLRVLEALHKHDPGCIGGAADRFRHRGDRCECNEGLQCLHIIAERDISSLSVSDVVTRDIDRGRSAGIWDERTWSG